MVSSFAVSIVLLILSRNGYALNTDKALLLTVAVTTICWIATAFLAPQTDLATLIAFYKKTRPFGPGWRKIRLAAGLSASESAGARNNIPLALLGWVAGCSTIWSSLFTIGNFLYGRLNYALFLLIVFIVSAMALLFVIHALWSEKEQPKAAVTETEVLETASDVVR
jgi:hypothetical protein